MAEIERTKNASRNILFGIVLKIYQIVVPFIMRTAMIYLLGVQYLGLNSLFTSILQVLNLAELGVGSAMVFSMYKPIAEDDDITICALMKLYKRYYFIIGLVILSVGVTITPFIPKLISGDVPAGINIYVLYILNLSATVASYWLFAYKNSILQAHQRTDVVSKVTIVTDTVKYISQITVLVLFRNYYYYVIVLLLSQILANIITAYFADKLYPRYQPAGKLDNEEVKRINQRIKDLFTAKLGTVFGSSADNIVTSAFLGLTVLAVYQNYNYILTSVMGFVTIMFSSIAAGIGNSIVVDSKEKIYKDFKKIALITIWICCVSVSCFAVLYQPFITLWVGGDLLLPYSMVILFCIYFYTHVLQLLSCLYKDAAGIWHQDRFRPLISGIVNLILNLSFVQFWGIHAIILSTIVSHVLIAIPWLIHTLFKYVFKISPKEYVIMLIKGFVLSAASACLCYFSCSVVTGNTFIDLLVRLVIVLLISDIVFVTCERKNESFNSSIDLLDKVTKHKFIKVFRILRIK